MIVLPLFLFFICFSKYRAEGFFFDIGNDYMTL